MSVLYERVALIGLGLIASSMAHAMRRHGLVGQISGTARSKETIEAARDIGFCDKVTLDVVEAVSDADLVVLAVPGKNSVTKLGQAVVVVMALKRE